MRSTRGFLLSGTGIPRSERYGCMLKRNAKATSRIVGVEAIVAGLHSKALSSSAKMQLLWRLRDAFGAPPRHLATASND